MSSETNAPWGGRWARIILVVSLSVNLLIAGAIGAALWKHSGARVHHEPRRGDIWPIILALPRQDRDRLRQLQEARFAATDTTDEQPPLWQSFASALRQDPFDPGPVQHLLGAQADLRLRQLRAGNAALLERIVAMSDTERLEFADRIEETARRGRARPERRLRR